MIFDLIKGAFAAVLAYFALELASSTAVDCFKGILLHYADVASAINPLYGYLMGTIAAVLSYAGYRRITFD